MSAAQQVSIVVKNPAKSGDFRCSMNLHDRVADLKGKVEAEYDSNPAPDHQKLIFAGKLLQDDSVLADLLQQHDITMPQTFHLIVRPRTSDPPPSQPQSSQPSPSTSTQTNQQQAQQPGAGTFPPYGAQAAPGMANGGGGAYGYGGQHAGFMGYTYPGYMQPNLAYQQQQQPQLQQPQQHFYPPQMNEQLRQYLQQQQQLFQQQLHLHQHLQQQQHQQQQQPQQAQQQAQQVQPPQPQPQGQPAANRNNLSLLFKLGFLVLILSQGGDDERILVLCLVAVLVYLFQIGWIPLNRFNLPQPQMQDPHNPEARAGGVIGEITLILTSFVYSLFPTWQPPTPPPAPVPGPEPQAAQPPEPDNNPQ